MSKLTQYSCQSGLPVTESSLSPRAVVRRLPRIDRQGLERCAAVAIQDHRKIVGARHEGQPDETVGIAMVRREPRIDERGSVGPRPKLVDGFSARCERAVTKATPKFSRISVPARITAPVTESSPPLSPFCTALPMRISSTRSNGVNCPTARFPDTRTSTMTSR